jgi:hypothetical protein
MNDVNSCRNGKACCQTAAAGFLRPFLAVDVVAEIRVKSHARCLFPCYGDLERHLDPPERAISIFKVSHYSNLLRPCSNSSGGACYLVHKKKNPRFRRGFVVIGRL